MKSQREFSTVDKGHKTQISCSPKQVSQHVQDRTSTEAHLQDQSPNTDQNNEHIQHIYNFKYNKQSFSK